MNYKYFSIFILCILSLYIDHINSQIYYGPATDTNFWVDPYKVAELNFDVTNYTVGTNDAQRKYTRYDYSFLRIHLKNLVSNFHGYIDFHPRVDEFTTIKIPNSGFFYRNLDWADGTGGFKKEDDSYRISAQLLGAKNITTFSNQWVNVSRPCWLNGKQAENSQCNGTLETDFPVRKYYIKEFHRTNSTVLTPIELPSKRLFDYENQTLVQPFVIVIQLDKGKIIDAMWDGDRVPSLCKQCQNCIDNQCGSYVYDMSCDLYPDQCQLKFMVAWAGEDKNGSKCRSFDKIPSQFQKYTSTPFQQLGAGIVDDFLYRVTNDKDPNQA